MTINNTITKQGFWLQDILDLSVEGMIDELRECGLDLKGEGTAAYERYLLIHKSVRNIFNS